MRLFCVFAILILIVFLKMSLRKQFQLKKAWYIFWVFITPIYLYFTPRRHYFGIFVNPQTIQTIIGSRSSFGELILSALTPSLSFISVLIAFAACGGIIRNKNATQIICNDPSSYRKINKAAWKVDIGK